MSCSTRFVPIPETQLSFVNVPLVPVHTRNGETRYLCTTWGGAIHLFDADGNEKVITYPKGGAGCYSFTAAVEDGFAWAVHTGGFITRLDVDKGECDLIQEVPLKAMTLGAAITPDGFLVCTSSGFPPRAEVMVYDTKQCRVEHLFTPISRHGNIYSWYPRTAFDGSVLLPIEIPGGELIRLDPRNGTCGRLRPHEGEGKPFPLLPFDRSLTFLPDGRLAFPHSERIDTVTYPDLRNADPLHYPDARQSGWQVFRDHGDGRLFSYHADGGPLHSLDESCTWKPYLPQFSPNLGKVVLDKFCAIPDGGLLALSLFGELVRYDHDGSARFIKQLNNTRHQEIVHLQPTGDSLAFTTTFINMSFQEVDTHTGKGRNIRPCQKHPGQVTGTAWQDGKLWLATYGGAEINVYDPDADGEWPVNPRHVLDVGEEQMRPRGMFSDGRHLWTVTSAKYGLKGGALVRFEPKTETAKVWRNLVPDHNPTGLLLDVGNRRVYVGTTVYADQSSAEAAPLPATVIAFDMDLETSAWIARPLPDAVSIHILALPSPDLVLIATSPGYPKEMFLLEAKTGAVHRRFDSKLPPEWAGESFLVGGDGSLYVASSMGLFRYDLEHGPGEQILNGSVERPVVRGKDLFFIRGHEVGIAEGIL